MSVFEEGKMSAEVDALRVLRASLASTVVMWIRLWTSFRCLINRAASIPERAILASTSGPLGECDDAELKRVLVKCMTYSSPKGFKERSPLSQRYRRVEGIPLWTEWHRLVIQNEYMYT